MVYCIQPHGVCANFGIMMADVVAKPGAMKSPVCGHFGFEANESDKPIDESQPICMECRQTVAMMGRNTYNLCLLSA